MQRYTFLTELHHYNGIVVRCRCCDTNVARVEGVSGLADLYKAANIAIIDTIDEVRRIVSCRCMMTDGYV